MLFISPDSVTTFCLYQSNSQASTSPLFFVPTAEVFKPEPDFLQMQYISYILRCQTLNVNSYQKTTYQKQLHNLICLKYYS